MKHAVIAGQMPISKDWYFKCSCGVKWHYWDRDILIKAIKTHRRDVGEMKKTVFAVMRYYDDIEHPELMATYTDEDRANRKAATYKNATVYLVDHYDD